MKKVIRKSIVVFVVFAMLISTLGILSFTASAAPLLENGNFENGTTGFVIEKAGYSDAVVETVDDGKGGKMLKIDTQSTAGTLHAFRVYQVVTVEPNTNYVWELEFGVAGLANNYLGVVAGNSVNATGNTTLSTQWETVSGAITFTPNAIAAGAQLKAGTSEADPNWLEFGWVAGWNKVKLSFNSGDNTNVCLAYGTRHTGRAINTDNWVLYKEPMLGQILNGDFENGTEGFTNKDVATFEVIAEPGNTSNHVLHLIGGGIYYQQVRVTKNTDYIWTFRMKDLGNTGTTRILVNPYNGSNNLITSITQSGGGYATTNDGTYAGAATYNKAWVTFTVRFNSGDNETVKLLHNTWTTNREIYMDDWTFYEAPKVGAIVNGNFDNGTNGYSNMSTATFEVIAEPGNTANNVLHLIGGGNYYQQVPVVKNTDYIWTFRMKDIGNTGTTRVYVHPESDWSNLITSISQSGGGYASTNDGSYTSVATYSQAWVTFTVKFNSGDNENVKLLHNTWANNREIYMDDWTLEKEPQPGELRNGGFEDGLKYFVVADKATAEVSTEDVYDGTYSAKVNGKEDATAYGQFIYQEVVVEPNTDYNWSFWYKSKANNTTLVGVRTADDKYLLPSFIKTDAFVVEADRSFTTLRDVNKDLWHETLYNMEWKKYNVIFNSGDNTVVHLSLDFITSARGGFTDNWTLSEYTFMQGDADNDGAIDAKDLVEIRRHLLGTPSFYMGGIDINGDGQFSIADLVRFKKNFVSLSPIEGYSLVWADDFGGQYLDTTKWTRAQHMSAQDDLEIRYDETGIAVADGSATLYAGRVNENNYYTNAALTTANRDGSTHLMSFKYGYVEMRAKIPFGAPAFPSFWMKSVINNDVHGEIDIFEHFCYKGDTWIQSGVHKWYLDDAQTHLLNNSIGGINVPADGNWHTYGLLWTPESLEFKLDGVTYHTIDISANLSSYKKYTKDNSEGEIIEADNAIFHDYYYLIMNNYLHTPAGTGNADYAANSSTELPLEYEIDYVRLYQNSDGAIRLGSLQ